MKAFVTGGTGFIGSHLVDALLEDPGWDEVRCLVRNREKWLAGKSYQKIDGDLHDTRAMERGLEGADVAFHLAAIVKAPSQREFDEVNVDTAEALIHAARKAGVGKIVVLSSLAAAGPSRGTPLDEDARMNPVSMYGDSKKRMEEMIQRTAGSDQSITILRPPVVYGPREEQLYTYFRMLNRYLSPVIGDGEAPKVSMVYVSDLVNGILLASNEKRPGVETYFITGPNIYTWNRIRNISARVLGKKPLTLHIKPDWVKKIAGLVETTASYWGSYPVLNREKADEMILEWTCSSKKAEKELNYSPTVTLEEGISRTIHWYKKNHWL